MLRFILIRKQRDTVSGAEWQEHFTMDADCPELEKTLGGGYGENGYSITTVIGVERRAGNGPARHD